MATVTRPSGSLPDPGDDLEAEPIRDHINNILTFLEANNIDVDNVDSTSTDGIMILNQIQTVTGAKTHTGNISLSGSATFDVNGIANAFILDADADTHISAPTDDQIDIAIGGSDLIVMATAGTTLSHKFTVGVNDTGYDAQFFGATAGAHMLWDESANQLKLVGGASLSAQGLVTVGVDDTGYDVKFFGATSGAHMLWDESADDLKLVGAAGLTVAGTSALNITTTTALTAIGAVTVGVNDTGHDVKFFGATSGAHLLWDESADTLKLVGAAKIDAQGTVTVGVDDTGYDVKFFGATASAYMLWDESADDLKLVGAAGLTVAGTAALNATTTTTLTAIGAVTVGVDDTGHDVKFFGATSGQSWLWDESADKMIVTGTSTFTGNTQQTGTYTVGVNDTGYDVQFFGATAGSHMLWDESANSLKLVGGASLSAQGLVTVGVDDTGYDVKFFGATTSKSMLWDESADTLIIAGKQTISETLGVTGVGTFTAQSVHTGGIQSGSNILSDTDSTDSLGSTGVRWLKLWVDSITSGGDIAAATFTGTLAASGVLADGVTGTTQSPSDNSTKVATTAYADASGGSGTGFGFFLIGS